MPTSFLCTFLIFLLTVVSLAGFHETPLMSPVGTFVTSIQVIFLSLTPETRVDVFQVVLLIYTVIPLPLYLCIFISFLYSLIFESMSISSSRYPPTPLSA